MLRKKKETMLTGADMFCHNMVQRTIDFVWGRAMEIIACTHTSREKAKEGPRDAYLQYESDVVVNDRGVAVHVEVRMSIYREDLVVSDPSRKWALAHEWTFTVRSVPNLVGAEVRFDVAQTWKKKVEVKSYPGWKDELARVRAGLGVPLEPAVTA